MATDPGGCWVAVDADDRPIGVALALVREGSGACRCSSSVPTSSPRGAGGALLRAALAHGARRAGRDHPRLGRPARAPRVLTGRASPCTRPPCGRHATGGRGRPAVEPFDPPATPRWPPRSTAPSAAPRTARPRGARRGRRGAARAARPRLRRPIVTAASRCSPRRDEAAARALLRTALARASGKAEVSWLTGRAALGGRRRGRRAAPARPLGRGVRARRRRAVRALPAGRRVSLEPQAVGWRHAWA